MQPAQFLKTLVIVLGMAIVVALGFVIYGVARLTDEGRQAEPASAPPTAAAAIATADLGQPTGTEIAHIVPLSSTRVMIALRGGAMPDRAVIFDLTAGRVVGTITTTTP
jgi:hypothetical protein